MQGGGLQTLHADNAGLTLTKVGQTERGMGMVNIYQAKTNLSRLVDQASAGEEIIIAKDGKPMARLVPLEPARLPRPIGKFKGQVPVVDDFDTLYEEEIRAVFEDGE